MPSPDRLIINGLTALAFAACNTVVEQSPTPSPTPMPTAPPDSLCAGGTLVPEAEIYIHEKSGRFNVTIPIPDDTDTEPTDLTVGPLRFHSEHHPAEQFGTLRNPGDWALLWDKAENNLTYVGVLGKNLYYDSTAQSATPADIAACTDGMGNVYIVPVDIPGNTP